MDGAGNIADYEGVNKVPKAMLPLIAVNTTAGTASEMTRFAIITDHARKVKMAIIDWYAPFSAPQQARISQPD